MSPEEKAKELLNKFYNTSSHSNSIEVRAATSKQSVIILCEEMIDYVSGWDKENEMEFNEDGGHVDFWEMVKAEINGQ